MYKLKTINQSDFQNKVVDLIAEFRDKQEPLTVSQIDAMMDILVVAIGSLAKIKKDDDWSMRRYLGMFGLMGLYGQIREWNKSINNLEFDDNLEVRMLYEEVLELLGVEKDEIKKAISELEITSLLEDTESEESLSLDKEDYKSFCCAVISMTISGLKQKSELLHSKLKPLLGIVVKANAQKTQRGEDGKIVKPIGFIPPEETIRAYCEQLGVKLG